MDTGNPAVATLTYTTPKASPGPIFAGFTAGTFMKLHAVFCRDKVYEAIEEKKQSIVMYPSSYAEIKIPKMLYKPQQSDEG